jgi:hypothetical protein
MGFKVGAEIGVNLGKYSYRLCKYNPNLKLYCIDPWLSNPLQMYPQEWWDNVYAMATTLLEGKSVEIMRMTSEDAAKIIPDNSLDFVYIDAMHDFESVVRDLSLWYPKVRKEGVVSGHDYIPICGVVDAVNGFTKSKRIGKLYITAEPIRIKSWFFVK